MSRPITPPPDTSEMTPRVKAWLQKMAHLSLEDQKKVTDMRMKLAQAQRRNIAKR